MPRQFLLKSVFNNLIILHIATFRDLQLCFQSEQTACGPEIDLHILLWFLCRFSVAILTSTVISEFSPRHGTARNPDLNSPDLFILSSEFLMKRTYLISGFENLVFSLSSFPGAFLSFFLRASSWKLTLLAGPYSPTNLSSASKSSFSYGRQGFSNFFS